MSGDYFFGVVQNDSAVNETVSCAAESIGPSVTLPHYSKEEAIIVRSVQAIYFGLLALFGCLLNVLVISLVGKFKKLHTLSFAIGLQVVVLDLLLATFVFGLTVIPNIIANRWLFGEHFCYISGSFFVVMVSERTILMFVFVLDRFLIIFWPFSYKRHNLKAAIFFSILSWCISISGAIIPAALDCYRFGEVTWVCALSASCNTNCALYNIIYIGLILAPFIVIPVILYAILYIKVRRIRKKLVPQSSSYESTTKNWRTAITFFLLFVSLLVVTLPNVAISIIGPFVPESVGFQVVTTISASFTAILVITDPILIMRNRDVRQIVQAKSLFQKWISSSYYSSSQ